MSMSLARAAMPSARMRAPSLTSAKMQRSTISSSSILRGVMPLVGAVLLDQSCVTGSGIGSRAPAS
jgi:hypothetical protein